MLTTYGRPRSLSPLPFVFLFLIIAVVVAVQMVRGVPAVVTKSTLPESTKLGDVKTPPWPVAGAASLAVKGLGVIGVNGDAQPRPIASVTKMMTAYVVLKDHPLKPGGAGETYSITAADVQGYLADAALDQSVVPVSRGGQFTQLEMMEAMLVPSANNFAEILATWDAGSIDAFVAKMNTTAQSLGMRNTIYADPSGFSAASKSTAADQLLLARAAMQDPVFASIVAMPTVKLPGAGQVSNVNTLLGMDGIAGIKTGFTEDAGDCLAVYAKRTVNGQTIEIFGVVLGQPTRPAVFDASRSLVNYLAANVQSVRVMSQNQVVGSLKSAWGGEVPVIAAEDAMLLLWPGMTLQATVDIHPVKAPIAAGAEVGQVTLKLGDQEKVVPLKAGIAIDKPGMFWRLTRL